MLFKEYLATLRSTYDAQGDFVRLARVDADMPDVTAWSELETHLISRNASYAMQEAARNVWDNYERALKKAQKV